MHIHYMNCRILGPNEESVQVAGSAGRAKYPGCATATRETGRYAWESAEGAW